MDAVGVFGALEDDPISGERDPVELEAA